MAIIGNHDIWEGRTHIKDALKHAGIVVLDNQHHMLRLRDVELCIVGLDDESTGKPNPQIAFPTTPPTGPVIVLAHDPATFKRTLPHAGSLLLSGHTHGGQIRMPVLGALVIPSHAPLSWALGWTLTDSGPLYVTSGLGTSVVPLRFCCPPEYVIMDLQPPVRRLIIPLRMWIPGSQFSITPGCSGSENQAESKHSMSSGLGKS